ncbi:hypothetical protein WT26_30110 [Burkholderia cepacia]|uniref:Uncharacterized protein n=1 Tax=Burkholderia cepacia TaxID=292 RepID=A0A1B4Q1J7_BURCE|nr:hypothetical protein [Burkholderia cepacia]AOK20060.1 hypothetical protein WT26_30110 [Burkholderia cepacia]
MQIDAPGFVPRDDWFHLAPGTPARIALVPLRIDGKPAAADDHAPPVVEIRAVNAARAVRATQAG